MTRHNTDSTWMITGASLLALVAGGGIVAVSAGPLATATLSDWAAAGLEMGGACIAAIAVGLLLDVVVREVKS